MGNDEIFMPRNPAQTGPRIGPLLETVLALISARTEPSSITCRHQRSESSRKRSTPHKCHIYVFFHHNLNNLPPLHITELSLIDTIPTLDNRIAFGVDQKRADAARSEVIRWVEAFEPHYLQEFFDKPFMSVLLEMKGIVAEYLEVGVQ